MPHPPPTSSHSVAVEDYIKHIYKLAGSGQRATTKAIAHRLNLGRGTVTGMLQQLAVRGLVEYEPYRGVHLTEAGSQLALRIIRRHRLIELFLVKTLGFGWHDVHNDAERLEHAVSDDLIERIDEYLGHPNVDPHGAPIPTATGQVAAQDFTPLAQMPPGATAHVRRVSDHEPNFLTYLKSIGVELGVKLKVLAVDPFGTMHVKLPRGEAHLAREATQRIHVSVD